MPYPYGMQSSPAVGNGLGGLPRRPSATVPKMVDFYYPKNIAETTTYTVPPGYQKMRVSVIGKGGNGTVGGNAGSGAGCAVSFVRTAVPGTVVTINFVGTPLNASAQKTVTTVSFQDQTISASSGYQSAGTGTGGEFNYVGGSFSGTFPGAGASPDGNGGNATSSAPGVPAGGPYALGAPGRGSIGCPAPGGGGAGTGDSGEPSAATNAGGCEFVRIELW